jgi:hypothetical protein
LNQESGSVFDTQRAKSDLLIRVDYCADAHEARVAQLEWRKNKARRCDNEQWRGGIGLQVCDQLGLVVMLRSFNRLFKKWLFVAG